MPNDPSPTEPNRFVYVVGSFPEQSTVGEESSDPRHQPVDTKSELVREVAMHLGRRLGKTRGFGLVLVSGRRNSAEYYALKGFTESATEKEQRIKLISPDRNGNSDVFYRIVDGRLALEEECMDILASKVDFESSVAPHWHEASIEAADRLADVVVILGGAQSSLCIGRVAIEKGKRIIPVAALGGSGLKLFKTIQCRITESSLSKHDEALFRFLKLLDDSGSNADNLAETLFEACKDGDPRKHYFLLASSRELITPIHTWATFIAIASWFTAMTFILLLKNYAGIFWLGLAIQSLSAGVVAMFHLLLNGHRLGTGRKRAYWNDLGWALSSGLMGFCVAFIVKVTVAAGSDLHSETAKPHFFIVMSAVNTVASFGLAMTLARNDGMARFTKPWHGGAE